jgi:hypothetical protein
MLSSADHTQSPPRIEIPRAYNAAHDLIERNLRAGRASMTALPKTATGKIQRFKLRQLAGGH